VPLKDKTAKTVLDAFKSVVKSSARQPKHLWVDEGKEFYNKDMTAWIKENDIIRYSTHGEHKSAVVERFNRTLKTNMWRRFTAENTRNWIDMLDKLMSQYNNCYHTTIRMKPIDAALKENESEVWDNVYNNASRNSKISSVKFKLGDTVRISRIKGLFEKGYLPNWSEALYKIHEIKSSKPVTYVIKDTNDEIISGSFYNEELQKSEQEIFRIEKVLRKKKIKGIQHGFVKWIGYNNTFNQWIPMTDIHAVNAKM
jgi:ribulose bisphosphate carboxylase small subunit